MNFLWLLLFQRRQLLFIILLRQQQIYFLQMTQKQTSQCHPSMPLTNKYDDWTCLLCNNHNYSFRLICNRCRAQTKEENAIYLNLMYEQQIQDAQAFESEIMGSYYADFPQVLLLVINNDPWEQQPQKRQPLDNINVNWISNLIQE